MAMTGYNPQQVSNSINQFKSAYKAYNDAMNTGLQNRFVKPMENIWGCEEAQNFFRNQYKPAIDALYNSVEKSLSSVVNAMNGAARDWARETESDFTPINHDQVPNAVNVDGIQADLNGVKGADLTEATATVAVLQNIKAEADGALDQANAAVSECGFIGGDQQAAISKTLQDIKKAVADLIESLNNATKNRLDDTVSRYGNTERANTDKFTA